MPVVRGDAHANGTLGGTGWDIGHPVDDDAVTRHSFVRVARSRVTSDSGAAKLKGGMVRSCLS